MRSILHQYKLRLTNLSQSNRSLKLARLSARRDLDFKFLDHLYTDSAETLLEKIIKGREVRLVKKLDPRKEEINLLDRRLNNIYRQVSTLHEESGAYDLFVGFPWVEGKFLDGSVARCPVMLFPVRLERNFTGSPRWTLSASSDEDVLFNKTFFLAYEKFQQVRLPQEFWEENPDHWGDIQEFLNYLYKFFSDHEIGINFNLEMFDFQLRKFPDMIKVEMDNLATGQLKLYPHAVLGIFPQSDSALVKDYDAMELAPDSFNLETIFAEKAPLETEAYIREEHRFFVAPVDQSQEEALLKVKNGTSTVLHGPPGTGKSQVILNIVADAMALGKKVLVVSQKRAALDVVYHRLAEVGLNRFAALVHDYRADRNKIFSHIRRQIEDIELFHKENRDLNVTKAEHDFRLASRQIDEFNHLFEELYQALTTPQECGLTMHQLYLLANSQAALLPVKISAPRFNTDTLQGLLTKINGIIEYLEYYRPDHPWRNRKSFASYGFGDKQELSSRIEATFSEVEKLHSEWKPFSLLNTPLLNAEKNGSMMRAFEQLDAQLADPELKQEFIWFYQSKLSPTSASKELSGFRAQIKALSKFNILNEKEWSHFFDLKGHFETYDTHKKSLGRFFNLKYLKARWYLKAILKEKDLELEEKELSILRKEVQALDKLFKHYIKLEDLPFFDDIPLTEKVGAMFDWVKNKSACVDFIRQVRDHKFFESLKPKADVKGFNEAGWEESKATRKALVLYNTALMKQVREWAEFLHPSQVQKLIQAIPHPEKIQTYCTELSHSFSRSFEDLRSLDAFLQEFNAEEHKALNILTPELEKLKEKDRISFIEQLKNSFFIAWIELAETQFPVLAEVSSRRFAGKQHDYRKTLLDREKIVTDLIHRKLRENITEKIEYNRLKNPVTYRKIAHQVGKKRLIWSVRKLVNEFWEEGLSTLMPCWLASPESVAAIFEMRQGFFDLVVFDEASQCYVERALPVMLRGNTCVIAGDEKQLQPFDLYSVKVDEEDAPFVENEMAMEVESALDLAKNVFSDSKLSWHYRSQEEELINFSNYSFYEGRLNVIPPAQIDPLNVPPIEWLRVQGRWESNRNQVEATHIIQLIEQLIQREDKPTIGVVTFNFHQQELIKDKLEERMMELAQSEVPADVKLASLFHQAIEREDQEERQGIFVKNIENVQGDERDIIIFSVAYARNEKGKLVTQFGLLSQKGGENRLNVAITRARQKIYMVCSFEPEELEVANAKNAGPRLFKKYLEYARAVSQHNTGLVNSMLNNLGETEEKEAEYVPTSISQGDSLSNRIYQFLKAEGYHVVRNVGDTNYKVDLAVKASADASGYVLGIECEGANYFSGKSAKEREVYRFNLLERRGWHIYRVWTRNFFLDEEKELQRVLSEVKAALEEKSPELK